MMKHKHHIIPKHMGGSNDPSNLVELTVEEHAEAHRKLFEQHGLWQDEIAWKMLSGQITMDEASKEAIRRGQLNSANKRRGVKWTEDKRQKLREASPHAAPYNKGLKTGPRSEETKEKIRKSLLNKKHSQERIEANRKGQLKRFSNPEERLKVSEQLKIARECKKLQSTGSL